jgi:hypothetical protein
LLRDERQHKAGFEPQQIAIGPCNTARVSNYIVKPFNAATLKTKMEAVLGPAE